MLFLLLSSFSSLALEMLWSSVFQLYCVLPSAPSHSLVVFSSSCVASNDRVECKQCPNDQWRKKKKQLLISLLPWPTRVNVDPSHLSATTIITIWHSQHPLDASKPSLNNSNRRLLIPRPSFNFRRKKSLEYVRMVVVPPATAAWVPVRKSSTDRVPMKGNSKWVCVSIPPRGQKRREHVCIQ